MRSTFMDIDGNIRCISGDPFDLHLIIDDEGTPIDFDGWSIHLRAFNPKGNTTIVEFNEDDVDTLIPGVLIFKKPAADSEFPIGTFNYDWKMGEPGKEPVTVLNNKLFIVE